MENETSGFNKMSEAARGAVDNEHGAGTISDSIQGAADQVSDKLKLVGVDADGAIEQVQERATDFQQMLMDEIRDRPLRALGWAAAIGFAFGIISAR